MASRNQSMLLSSSLSSVIRILLVAVSIFHNWRHQSSASAQQVSEDPYNYYYNYNNGGSENYGGGEYLSDWNSQEWVKLSGRIQQPKCVDIPTDLTLCQNIGYEKMMLPNLLDHDSLNEVTQQAASWVPLVRINCHPDSKVFLCSLFSPVCLDRLIYPCRSLCDGVRASCAGRMKNYGFDWPDMLKCDKFPLDNDMCIKLIHDIKPDSNCTACKHPLTHESMIDQFCRSDVAMRVSIQEFKDAGGHKQLILRKKKSLFKHEGLNANQARNLVPIIEGGATCNCDRMKSTSERYLIMGNKRGDQMAITFGMVWNRKDKEFKKGINAIRKGNTCEGIFRELSANGIENKPPTTEKSDKTNKKKDKKPGGEKKDKTDGKVKTKGKGKEEGKRKKGKKEDGKKKKENKNKAKSTKGKTSATSSNAASRRDVMSKTEVEDRALNNFMKASN